MKLNFRTLVAAVAACTAIVALALDVDEEESEAPITFERYQTIVERYPFGTPPPNFDPTDMSSSATAAAAERAASREERELTQEENKLKSAVRLCAFNLTPERRVMVGFVDNSTKPPQSFYMAVGDKRNGWTVQSADVDERTAVLEKDGIEVEVEFPKPGAAAASGKPGQGSLLGGRPGASGAGGRPLGGGGSALERLRERRAQLAKNAQEEEERKKLAAEKDQADRAAAAAEREQQKQQLLQIQEELRRQREAREQQREAREQQVQEGGEGSPVEL